MWGTVFGTVAGVAIAKSAGFEDRTVYNAAQQAYEQQTNAIARSYDRSAATIDQKLLRSESEIRLS